MLVLDTATGHVGVVRAVGDPYTYDRSPSCVWLLPVGGGFEWRARIADVRPAPATGGRPC
ncbi:hypothetical protein GCM10027168_58670 [Streptomyces capparidis]